MHRHLEARVLCAQALGKPLVIEEFGKAHDAAKLYSDPLPHPLQPGAHPPARASSRCHAAACVHLFVFRPAALGVRQMLVSSLPSGVQSSLQSAQSDMGVFQASLCQPPP